MPKKLNDTQIAEIIAKYSNGTSISALARDNNVSRACIKRYIDANADLVQKCTDKKAETITKWLKEQSDQIQDLLNLCIKLLPEKLKKASARDIVGAYKILTETSVNNVESKEKPVDEGEKGIEFVFTDTSSEVE